MHCILPGYVFKETSAVWIASQSDKFFEKDIPWKPLARSYASYSYHQFLSVHLLLNFNYIIHKSLTKDRVRQPVQWHLKALQGAQK